MSENHDDELTEKIKILATDDERIKSFGEVLTNDSSRAILQMLFGEDLTANQIAQKTGMSLQLARYHLNKLQELGVVRISKIEKNSKSQDMKVYSATKFSIVIVPPNLSEKTRGSKLLMRSFRHIYKVAGLAVATGVSGLLSLSHLQSGPLPVRERAVTEEPVHSDELADEKVGDSGYGAASEPGLAPKRTEASEESALDFSDESSSARVHSAESEQFEMSEDSSMESFDESVPTTAEPGQIEAPGDPALDFSDASPAAPEPVAEPEPSPYLDMAAEEAAAGPDLFVPLAILTAILGGLTLYYFLKSRKG